MVLDALPFGCAASAPPRNSFATQRAHKIIAGGKAVARLLGQCPGQRGAGRGRQVARHQLGRIKFRPAEHFAGQHGQRILVTARIGLVVGRSNFWGQIRAGRAGPLDFAAYKNQVPARSQPEIRNPHHAIRPKEYIAWLKVAVHHALLVHKIEPCRDLPQYRQRFCQRAPAIGARATPHSDVHPRRVITHHIGLLAHVHQTPNHRNVVVRFVRKPANALMDGIQKPLGTLQVCRQPADGHMARLMAVKALPHFSQLTRPEHRQNFVAIQQHRAHPHHARLLVCGQRGLPFRDNPGRLCGHDQPNTVIFPRCGQSNP